MNNIFPFLVIFTDVVIIKKISCVVNFILDQFIIEDISPDSFIFEIEEVMLSTADVRFISIDRRT